MTFLKESPISRTANDWIDTIEMQNNAGNLLSLHTHENIHSYLKLENRISVSSSLAHSPAYIIKFQTIKT
jgi:hypothetical protein